jgi:hydroxyethylthiazole kinase-like sugar kinase family protein
MMGNVSITRTVGRGGRPLVYSLTETFVFVLIAAALIATAAVPAMVRHPQIAQAQTRTAAVHP